MENPRKSKTNSILTDLIEKLNSGKFTGQPHFPTINELMLRYQISFGTAGKVVRELQAKGLIEAHKGRKSRIISGHDPVAPKLKKPIGVVGYPLQPFRLAKWRNAILQAIQHKILLTGNQPLWLPYEFDATTAAERYSGVIFSSEMRRQEDNEQWNYFRKTGLPCVKMDFLYIDLNSVFMDYRQIYDRIVLHLVKQKCRRIIFLFSSDGERMDSQMWNREYIHLDKKLARLGIGPEHYSLLTYMPQRKEDREALIAELQKSREKVAIITPCTVYNSVLLEETQKCDMEMHRDWELYATASLPDEMLIGNNVDMHLDSVAEQMVNMFYRQSISGEPQVGELALPTFNPCC